MKKFLSDQDRSQLNQQIIEAEKRTKGQIVLAVIKRSDSYIELPWIAFALGSSVAGLMISILDLTLSYWTSHIVVIVSVVAMLAFGAASALFTIFVPVFARAFLSAHRAEVEVRQYAESLFLKRELFATSKRTGILLLVSLFEHQVILLPDKGISNYLTTDATQRIITQMTSSLANNEVKKALAEGLDEITRILEACPLAQSAPSTNELPDEIIEEKGV